MAGDEEFEMESCRACRATGKVISNLGGTSAEVECPWCEGTGKFIPDHDGQAKAPGGGKSASESGEKAPEPAEATPGSPVDA